MHVGVPRQGSGGLIRTLVLLLCASALAPAPSRADEPRFGDSTWVAPGDGTTTSPTAPGPRVAEPDHERTWETVLRTPFRVAFFPLRLVTLGFEASGPLVERLVPPSRQIGATSTRRGLHVGPAFSYSGAAGPGAGLAINSPGMLGPGSTVGLTGTWSLRDSRRARFRALTEGRIGFGLEGVYDYRPNRRFYGLGNESPSERTVYLRRDETGTAYAFLGPKPLRRLRASVGLSDIKIGGGYNDSPLAENVFTESEVPFLTRSSRAWWYGPALDLAALNDSLNPSLGAHLRTEARRIKSTHDDFEFDSWRVEGRTYLPVFADYRVLALRLVYEGADPRGGSGPIPFYRLPTAIDADRFIAYKQGRYVDQRLALAHVEYRWLLLRNFWAAAIAQWGEVASSTDELTLRHTHHSYGGGLRMHTGAAHTARLDVATGEDGLNVYLDLKGDF